MHRGWQHGSMGAGCMRATRTLLQPYIRSPEKLRLSRKAAGQAAHRLHHFAHGGHAPAALHQGVGNPAAHVGSHLHSDSQRV